MSSWTLANLQFQVRTTSSFTSTDTSLVCVCSAKSRFTVVLCAAVKINLRDLVDYLAEKLTNADLVRRAIFRSLVDINQMNMGLSLMLIGAGGGCLIYSFSFYYIYI